MPAKNKKSKKFPHDYVINVNVKDKWEKILSDVEKPEVPLKVMDRMVLILIDGTKLEINVSDLISQYENEIEDVEHLVGAKLNELDHLIQDIDFYVNVEAVAKAIQPMTDKLLQKL